MNIAPTLTRFLEALAGLTVLYNLLVASRLLTWFGFFLPAAQHRAASLLLALTLIYCLRDRKGRRREGLPGWYDLLFLALGLVGAGYVAFTYDVLLEYSSYGYLDATGMVLASMLVLATLEAARRLTGWVLPSVVLAFVFMTIFQQFLPGLLHGKGYAPDRLLYAVYASGSGLFGVPLGVAATILIVYLVFASLLQASGAGEWFIDLALSLTGRSKGGPAKAAVVSSGFFGMISGSPSANVASTGTFTIPLMKKIGYPAHFAGAVEAVASTGGQFMPPVMGAVAFIMAEWLAVPYTQVALAAFLPAVLYYVVLFASVHFEASRLGLRPISASELPSTLAILKRGWQYLPALATLVYLLLVARYQPEMAAVLAIVVLLPTSFLCQDKDKQLRPRKIWRALVASVQGWLTIVAVTAAVGILIGSLELSGLGVKFSSFILSLSGDNLLAALLLIGLASFILGTGLDAIPAYMTLAALAAPALIKLGVPPMVAHLYVIYWGLSSFITPPVALAVYVACGISGSKIWETGWEAVRLGIAVYLIPFAFVLNQALVLNGSAWEVALAATTALAGAILVAAATRGYFHRPLFLWQRALLLLGGIILIGPGLWTPPIGITFATLGLLGRRWSRLRSSIDRVVAGGSHRGA